MLSKVRQGHIVSTFLLMILILILSFYQQESYENSSTLGGPLYTYLKAALKGWAPVWVVFVSIVLLLFQGLVCNLILSQNKIFNRNNFLFVLVYILIGLQSISSQEVSTNIILLCFFPAVLYQFIELYRSETPAYANVFNLGLVLGGLLLVEVSYFIYVVAVIFPLIRVKSINLRFWLLYLMGLCLPIYVYLSITYLLDLSYWNVEQVYDRIFEFSQMTIVFYIALLLYLIAGSFNIQSRFARLIALKRKFHFLNYFLLLGGLALVIVDASYERSIVFYLLLPLAILITDWFNRLEKKWVYELVWMVFLALAIL